MIQTKTRQQAEKEKQNTILNQEANKTKRTSTNQKQTWTTGRKEERKEQERDKKEKGEKGGGPKKAEEKQRETQINKQKWPFLGAKTGLFYFKQREEKQKQKPNKIK